MPQRRPPIHVPAADLVTRLNTADERDLVRYMHDAIRMTDADLGRALDAHVVTVRRWLSKSAKSVPRKKEHLDDLRAIVVLLLQSGTLYPEEVGRFLRARNEDLGWARPTVLLGQGKFDEIRKAAEKRIRRLEGRL